MRSNDEHTESRADRLVLSAGERLGRVAGSRGRTLAVWVDSARALGLRHVVREVRSDDQHASMNRRRDAVYERIWREAAAACGADVEALGGGFVRIVRGEASTRVWQQVVSLDDPVALKMALDKPLVHRLLEADGIPVPQRVEIAIADAAAAYDFLVAAPGPVVVKPARGSAGGDGTTGGVRTAVELRRALLRTARWASDALVERQAAGDVYRLLLLDGELIDVLRHRPASVVGDGSSTLAELIDAENRRRADSDGSAGLQPLTVNLDCAIALGRAGLTLATVPAAGETVRIKSVTNDNRAEDAETWRGEVHPSTVDLARRAAAHAGLRLAGVDLVTPDAARPLAETAGVVIEVNGTPGLHHHYRVADPAGATPVAVPVLEALLGGERPLDRRPFARSAS